MRRAEGGPKIFGVFRVKNHDFTPKNNFFPILGGAPPPPLDPLIYSLRNCDYPWVLDWRPLITSCWSLGATGGGCIWCIIYTSWLQNHHALQKRLYLNYTCRSYQYTKGFLCVSDHPFCILQFFCASTYST